MNTDQTVDKYYREIPETFKVPLTEIRAWVHELFPEGEEVFAYNIPAYKYQGKALFSIAAFKDHYSLVSQDKNIAAEIPELSNFKISGTTIHFTQDKPLTKPLLKTIIENRIHSREQGR